MSASQAPFNHAHAHVSVHANTYCIVNHHCYVCADEALVICTKTNVLSPFTAVIRVACIESLFESA